MLKHFKRRIKEHNLEANFAQLTVHFGQRIRKEGEGTYIHALMDFVSGKTAENVAAHVVCAKS